MRGSGLDKCVAPLWFGAPQEEDDYLTVAFKEGFWLYRHRVKRFKKSSKTRLALSAPLNTPLSARFLSGVFNSTRGSAARKRSAQSLRLIAWYSERTISMSVCDIARAVSPLPGAVGKSEARAARGHARPTLVAAVVDRVQVVRFHLLGRARLDTCRPVLLQWCAAGRLAETLMFAHASGGAAVVLAPGRELRPGDAAALSRPGFATLLDGHSGDEERGDRIGPPPSEGGVRAKADE